MGWHQGLVENFEISREEILPSLGTSKFAIRRYWNTKDSRLNAFFIAFAVPADESISNRPELPTLLGTRARSLFKVAINSVA